MVYITSSSYRPSLKDFREASRRIASVAIRTPLVPLRWYKENPDILLKPETLQPIGSYKIRGVYNWTARLDPQDRARGISTLSSGNMAQAVAYVGNLFGVPARAVIFDTAPRSKIDAVKRYGAEVVILSWKDTSAYLEKPPSDRCFIHPLAEYGLMDGHGTIGLENMEDAPDTETIFVALGGGLLGPVLRSQRRRSNPQCARAISLAAALETPKEKRWSCFKEGKQSIK